MVRAFGAIIALGVVLSPTERTQVQFPELHNSSQPSRVSTPLSSQRTGTQVLYIHGFTYIDAAKILTYIK